jgi:hypothetical protein
MGMKIDYRRNTMFRIKMVLVAVAAVMLSGIANAYVDTHADSRRAAGGSSASNSLFDESNISKINANTTGGSRITTGVRTISVTGFLTSGTANTQTVGFVLPSNTVEAYLCLGVGETATAIVGVSTSSSVVSESLGNLLGFAPVTVAKPIYLGQSLGLRVGATGATIYTYVPTVPAVAVRIVYVVQ